MTTCLTNLALAVAVFLLLAMPAAAEKVLPREGKDHAAILFRTGMDAMAAAGKDSLSEDARDKLLDEAIAAFRAILIDRPELVRVRLELARAFFLKREDNLARRHFERVLAGKPPVAVAANIRRFLAVIRARRQWSGYFGLAIAPDSNINAADDDDVIHLDTVFGRFPFKRDAAAGVRSGVGFSVWGGGEYEHPLTDRLRLRAGADFSRQEYESRRFDRTHLGLHIGPSWLVGAHTEVGLRAEAWRQWSGGRPNSDALGTRLEVGHQTTRRLRLHAEAAWRERDYRRGTAFDGPTGEVSLGASWTATPTLQVRVVLGHDRERPRTKAWRNATNWGRLGASVLLPWGFTAGASGGLRWTDYEGGGRGWAHYTEDGGDRSDRTRTLRVSLLNRGLTVAGFSPRLALVNEVRSTNAQLQDYRRNRAEISFVRQF